MRIAVAGGGPGGLFFATLMRRADPSAEITVFERNRADDTFGFGVVFSDRTLAAIDEADPVLREALSVHGRHWDDIEVRLKGERIRCGGNGMASVVRRTLLSLLQARAAEAGADLRFSTYVTLDDLAGYDLVVAADGTGSAIRSRLEERLGADVETATAKFIWFGTDYLFDGLTFLHERGPHGVFAVHGYPISEDVSTFIVETDEESWRRAGLDEFDVTRPPGPSDVKSREYLEKLFAGQIDGGQLLVNNSRWGNFRTRRTKRWHTLSPRPVVFVGDAVHTAHFSVGSGTKMAMEDSIALTAALAAYPGDLAAALAAYEEAAQPSVRKIQDSARPSLSWWEHFGTYYDQFEPWQFAYHFFTRALTDGRLARRAPDFVSDSHTAWAGAHGPHHPLRTPFASQGWSAPVRVAGVTVIDGSAGQPGAPSAVLTAGSRLTLSETARSVPDKGLWGCVVAAPESEAGLPAARARLDELAAAGPALAAVHGGTPLTRVLLCEHARFARGLPALLVEPDLDTDRAVTMILSGRADLVGVPPETADAWRHDLAGGR
ncbi:MAG TPA: FAD-dependent monooxygenase [Trebonia sp.]